ncbi:MAG: hypothetical protein R3F35_18810 [Myxococcota bacterium]
MHSTRRRFRSASAIVLASILSGSAQAVSLTPLGVLEGDVYSDAAAISPDGSTILGTSRSPTGGARIFIEDRVNGMRAVPGVWPDEGDVAVGMSDDGSIVAGNSGVSAFIWHEAHGPRALVLVDGQVTLDGDPGNAPYIPLLNATGLSSDGSTVVGRSENGAFVWDAENGIRDLGGLPTGRFPYPTGVSADGSIVVGVDRIDGGDGAFIWDSANGMRPLGSLPGGDGTGWATAVSDSGSHVVGVSASAFGVEAFLWDAVNGMQGLGDLPGGVGLGDFFLSTATDVSADGKVVVGIGFADDGYKTFVWDAEHGMRDLEVMLRTMGVDLSGWRLNLDPNYSEFPKISADGRTIVAIGEYNGERASYRVVIPEPASAALLVLGLSWLGATAGWRSAAARRAREETLTASGFRSEPHPPHSSSPCPDGSRNLRTRAVAPPSVASSAPSARSIVGPCAPRVGSRSA